MPQLDREKLRSRLKALMSKTVENGCTEAEATAAAQKAAELMKEHSFSAEEISIISASMARETKHATLRERLWATISHVTNTAAIYAYEPRIGGNVVIFYGNDPWPEVAVYLRDICNRAISAEVAQFRKSKFYQARRTTKTRRQAVADFTQGMVGRLCLRIYDLFRDTMDAEQYRIALQARDRQYPSAVEISAPKKKERFVEAQMAGWDAGNSVGLHHGVGGAGEQLKIGGAS